MRTSKLYLAVCAAALCGSIVAVRAADTPAQAAARAALEAKMHQLNTQAESTNVQTPAPAMPERSAQKPQAAPAMPQQPAPAAATSSGAAKQEPANPPTAATAMPSSSPAMASQTMRPASTGASSGHGLFAPVPPPSGGASIEVPSEESGQPSVTRQSPAPVAPAAPVAMQQPVFMESSETNNVGFTGTQFGLKPITAPPLPISAAQQAQLQALLGQYDANAITPEQYQAGREKILAESKK